MHLAKTASFHGMPLKQGKRIISDENNMIKTESQLEEGRPVGYLQSV